jgi:hypothetical protein
MPHARVAHVASSAWIPAALLAILVATLQLASGTSSRDLLAFTVYAVLALVLPGTLLWRLLRPAVPRLWLEDVVFGAVLGYAVEIVCYIAARAVGAPLLVLSWPVAVYAVCVLTRRGRAAWRGVATERVSTGWSWGITGVLAYLTVFIARANWWQSGLTTEDLRSIGPDGSFQLAMTGELRHHLLPTVPWVAGEPLRYHWLTYVHTAAATWVTGIEPIVMLRRLAPLLMVILIVLAVAVLARRLSGRGGVGLLAAGLLVLVHSPAFAPAEADHFQRQEFTSQAIFGSPTMTFGSLMFCGVLLLSIEVLRDRDDRRTWLLLALFLATASGAKATFAPMMVAGALAVVAVALIARSPLRQGAKLLAITASSWLAFQLVFYAGDSGGATVSAHGTLDFAARSFGALTPSLWSTAGVALAAVIVALWAVHMAGMVGLLVHGGWRDPVTAFAFGFTASGVGGALLLDLGAASQQWFVCATQVMTAVAAAWGFSRLVPSDSLRDLVPIAATAALLGASAMAVAWALGSSEVPGPGPTLGRLWAYAAPFLLTLAALAVLAVVMAALPSPAARGTVAVVFVCSGLTGLGLFRTTQLLLAMAEVPWSTPAPAPSDATTVGEGGVEAARWVRAHSTPDQLVATNGHALAPDSALPLAFWLAGYGERHVLVEGWGWAYTPDGAHTVTTAERDTGQEPFWDGALLAANDAAFTAPTLASLDVLRARYGVTWLVVDRRFPADIDGLDALLLPAYERGDYTVFRLG